MKIVYLVPVDLQSEVAATQRVLMIAKAFVQLGHEVVFIDHCPKGKREYTWNGFQVFSLRRADGLRDGILFKISTKQAVQLLQKIEKPDLLIAYNYPGIALRRLYKHCRKKNIRCIADAADWPYGQRSLIHRFLMWIDISVRMHYTHKKMDGLIVISEYLSNFYSGCIHVKLPPMIDADDEKWKSDTYISGQCVTLANVTTAGPDKENLAGLLNALSECRKRSAVNFQLSIMGMTEEAFNQVHHAAVPENIKDSVTFMGRVSHLETIKKIKGSDYFAFFRESNRINEAGFPTKFVEAVSCGTPVITTRTSDLDEYLHSGENGFFIDTEDDLYSALLQSQEARNQMHAACKNNRIFDFRLFAERIEDSLNRVMGE